MVICMKCCMKNIYFGKELSGNIWKGAMVDLQHRSPVAWIKFHERRDTLLDRHVSFKLQLKRFDCVINRKILFCFFAFTSNQLQQLEVVRNHMLRSFVGWAPLVGSDWHVLTERRVWGSEVRMPKGQPSSGREPGWKVRNYKPPVGCKNKGEK